MFDLCGTPYSATFTFLIDSMHTEIYCYMTFKKKHYTILSKPILKYWPRRMLVISSDECTVKDAFVIKTASHRHLH